MSEEEHLTDRVAGERDADSIARISSAQSRVSSLLALALMSLLGVGSLTWYYAHALMGGSRSRDGEREAAARRAQGDVPLPALHIEPPSMSDPAGLAAAEPPAPAPGPVLAEISPEPITPAPVSGYPPPKSPAEVMLQRELSGAVFVAAPSPAAPGGVSPLPGDTRAAQGSEMGALLRPTAAAAVRAERLPDQRLFLPKGAFIDCTLETAIDSTLPGMTTCVMASDTFGADGTVVLMERGTKLVGETRGQVQQGSARIFVVWTEARTPGGVVVPLDSPGADELGRSGLAGEVNRHFWQRFGAAMLVSVIDGAVQAAVQSSRGGAGTVVVNPSASQDVLTEILRNTVGIPPTVVKQNGDRIQVLVARDLDFRSVYELRSATPR